MKENFMIRKIIIYTIYSILILVIIFISICFHFDTVQRIRGYNIIYVKNIANQSLEIIIKDRNYKLNIARFNLEKKESRKIKFKPKGDDSLTIICTWGIGKSISKNFGYYTPGPGVYDILYISDQEIIYSTISFPLGI